MKSKVKLLSAKNGVNTGFRIAHRYGHSETVQIFTETVLASTNLDKKSKKQLTQLNQWNPSSIWSR
jgi:hypothetical protein